MICHTISSDAIVAVAVAPRREAGLNFLGVLLEGPEFAVQKFLRRLHKNWQDPDRLSTSSILQSYEWRKELLVDGPCAFFTSVYEYSTLISCSICISFSYATFTNRLKSTVFRESMFRHVLKQKAFSLAGWRTLDRCARPGAYGLMRCHGSLRPSICRTHVPYPSQPATYGWRSITSLSSDSDTIYALSSAQGRAGIAVIRISGPACSDVSLPPTAQQHRLTLYRYTRDCVPRSHSPKRGMR